MTREFLTDEELLRVFALLRTPREPVRTGLEAAPPEGALPNSWDVPELDLTIRLEEAASGVRIRLTGGADWRGALVHCYWNWQREGEAPESLTAFVLMPERDFAGRYIREAYIPERVTFRPAVVIVPRYADPEVFLSQWQRASVKPGKEELRRWIEANLQNFAPRHRQRWEQIRDEAV